MRAIKTTTISILAVGLLAGSAVGVTGQGEEADPMAISAFHGAVVEETDSGIVIEMTDARASGELSLVDARTEFRNLDSGPTGVVWSPSSARLVNEDGSWIGTGTNVGTAWGDAGGGWLMTGEGAYTGLVMWLGEGGSQGDDFWGAIVPADVIPPFPELPAE